MTEQSYFETLDTARRKRFAKRGARDEGRDQRKLEAALFEDRRLRATISDLERILTSFDCAIEAELEDPWIKHPSHTTRALVVRRDNLKSTIAVLSAQLAKIEMTLPEPVTARG
jgi:hypothetical protein